MKNNIVFVLGMHRSGTSMLTSMVEASGYHCGDNLQPPGSDNPNGYWEDLVMLRINESLLRALGKDWSSLGTPEYSEIEELLCFDELKSEAVGYLTQQINKYQRLVVKDPRVCILLPFWLSVCKELNATSKFLIIKRDAAAIVQSLHKRDLMDPVYAMQLVMCYWAQIAYCVITKDNDWSFVDYESISSQDQHSMLAKRLGSFLDADSQDILKALTNYKSEMNHSVQQGTELQTICFDFQKSFCEAFPCALTCQDLKQYQALSFVHQSLSFWGDTQGIIQKVSQSLARFSADITNKKIVVYGAGTVAKSIVGHLGVDILCGVDKSVFEKTTLLNIAFHPINYLRSLDNATILVTVTGRKEVIRDTLANFNHKLIFIEDFFNDHANY
ncbi:MAG: hypothetical protein ABJJ44_07250 [Paraglaciecola sp.]|uniref:sulfotransferase family protein n=1 Tax=Paraglaciecola sp. TaxID=1920173 RepID=UPI00329A302D